jgi:hypothetical protein
MPYLLGKGSHTEDRAGESLSRSRGAPAAPCGTISTAPAARARHRTASSQARATRVPNENENRSRAIRVPLCRAYANGRAAISNSYAPTDTLATRSSDRAGARRPHARRKCVMQYEPPSRRPSSLSRLFRIGRNSHGNWVVRDQRGLCGGLFVNRTQALKFAMFENGNCPQAVIMVPGILELNLSAVPAQDVQPAKTDLTFRRAA